MSLGITGTKIHMLAIRKVEILEDGKFKVHHKTGTTACGRKLNIHGWNEKFNGFNKNRKSFKDSCCKKCLESFNTTVKEVLKKLK